ncbi:3-hydroxyacyl-CoA dehydrogenase NAD-binding domain-containing protein [Parendozoicomonas haliclonae]|uniref:Fatty acid oxidation complex subunit alpha n=1 Tax=Parendozoicomonas haliclonae TaxID=1960125 RepID=A0A1X7APC1_9GAMM|nr:3-hydroxyacyl-CoA dehydrogenase NAD-binding domain-containing protein [Parendozoicomonas haliclonae]SMA49940.1 Fatty acid oxidation complex subunit alpha [Parendozoicomonas haliclonae]
MSTSVDYQKHDSIALMTLNCGPVNSLGLALRTELLNHFRSATEDESIKAIVITGSGRFFCAGADVTEFDNGKAFAEPRIPTVFDEIDRCPKPVIAAVNGTALGGGLELALACDYRIVHSKAQLGLPEVNLGIIPGAGGTQRLPRLIDLEPAARMIMGGKPVTAEEGKAIGLVDAISNSDEFVLGALTFAREQAARDPKGKNYENAVVNYDGDTDALLNRYLEKLHPQRNMAQLACVSALKAACKLPFAEGQKVEWEQFGQCHAAPQSRALQHLFFAERQATRVEGVSRTTQAREVGKVAVIGAGLMGGGIAMCFASAGIPVTLLELNDEALCKRMIALKASYQRSVDKGRLSQEQADRTMSLISSTSSYQDLADADLVVEAVFESMEVKQQVFRQLDDVCKPGCILASNTSTLDLDVIAACTARPSDVIGLHFFSPANVMRLLEIVRGKATAPEVLATALQVAKRIRKQPVVVGVCYGFVGNRMVAPYSREAFRMILEGAAPEQVDQALTDFGMAMGPISMGDMAGIDVGCAAAKANQHQWADDDSYQALQFALQEQGRLGQKTGAGVYRYKGREKINDPETIQLSIELAGQHAITRRELSSDEILERCLFSLINEGAHILEEGIAARASDIDLIYVNGYGFPAWRGGPMHYANEIGLDKVVARLNRYRTMLGAYGELWFKPAPLLERLAAAGKTF